MKMNSAFYFECNLAGRKYYDANEVWQELFVGVRLSLVRDMNNRYDPNAIQVVYERSLESFVLGYIPMICNEELSKFLDMGWNDAFCCRISKISPDKDYENQIRLTISIVRNSTME